MSSLLQRRPVGLDTRLEALDEAVSLAGGRLPETELAAARQVIRRAGKRLGLGVEFTVAALAGGTGSGKSSLFNALSGSELSPSGARRPTTGVAHACVWGEPAPDALLDWLAIPQRHQKGAEDAGHLGGLVLLDLPDSDSTEIAHRVEVDRLVEIVDLLVWVLDPQKYADAALHERYLRPLASHAAVMVLVLNQVDRLEPSTRRACLGDIERLARIDGLEGVPVIPTSAVTGEGLDALEAELARRVGERRSATERLAADVASTVDRLSAFCGGKAATSVRGKERDELIDALADAGGVERVADAVAQAHVHRAVLATGSPFTRWLRRLRPDPLRRLHLASDRETVTRTSLPEPSPVQRAKVGMTLRRLADSAATGLPAPWPRALLAGATEMEDRLPAELDQVVGHTDLGDPRSPRWWRLIGVLQTVLAAAAIAGALWLTVLFFFDWMKLPALPLPRVRRLPWPTILLVGGILAGLLVAFISRQVAGVGARRRRWSARRRLRAEIEGLADREIVAPLNQELAAYDRFCAALDRARRGRGSGSP